MSQTYRQQQEILFAVPPKDFRESVRDSMSSLLSRGYWKPTRDAFTQKLSKIKNERNISEKDALVLILDYLAEVMENSEPDIMKLIKRGGKDVKQSRVSVAGNNFQALVAYSLLANVMVGNLPKLEIVLKPKKHPMIEKYAVINVVGETQKPDMDILIYQDKPSTPLIICSCKTSLRERAGQTYKWKLLVDLATADPKHLKHHPECPINKYQITYKSDRKIYVTMITADFYNEVSQPQQRGMFVFFDKTFVADKGNKKLPSYVQSMSKIIPYLNSIYKS